MPRRVKSICRRAGCGALIEKLGHCAKHMKAKQVADAEQRGTANDRSYTSAWTKARAVYLRAHPLCVHCAREGRRVVPAHVVDHIIPPKLKTALDSGDQAAIARAQALLWDSAGNRQPLCKSHHDRKTATEDGGFDRVKV